MTHHVAIGDTIELHGRYRIALEPTSDGGTQLLLEPVQGEPEPQQFWPKDLGPKPRSIEEWRRMMAQVSAEDAIVVD